jgi:hypothetical protein
VASLPSVQSARAEILVPGPRCTCPPAPLVTCMSAAGPVIAQEPAHDATRGTDSTGAPDADRS